MYVRHPGRNRKAFKAAPGARAVQIAGLCPLVQLRPKLLRRYMR